MIFHNVFLPRYVHTRDVTLHAKLLFYYLINFNLREFKFRYKNISYQTRDIKTSKRKKNNDVAWFTP